VDYALNTPSQGSASPAIGERSSAGSGVVTGTDDSVAEHVANLQAGAIQLLHHPLGAGLGEFGTAAARTGASRYGEDIYLVLGGETGWLGLSLLVAITAGSVAMLMRNARSEPLMLALAVGGASLALIGIESDLWGDFVPTWVFWWLVGHVSRRRTGLAI